MPSYQSTATSVPILTGYGILDREFKKELGVTSPKFSDFSVLKSMKMLSKLKPNERVNQHSFYYYEKGDHLKVNATIAAVTNTTLNGTPSVLITLSTADHYNSGKNSVPIKGNDVVFANQVTGYIYDIDRSVDNAHVIKVKSVTGSTDVQTAAVVNSVILFAGVSVSEGSSPVEMRNPTFNKITNQIKTTRGFWSTKDHAEQHTLEFTLDGQPYLHPIGIADTADHFELDEELALLTNNINTATVTDLAGNSINTTLGLIPNINANGTGLEYYGDIDLSTVQDWFSTIKANYGDGEYMCLAGMNLGFAFQNWMADFGKYDPSYAYFSGFNLNGASMSGKDQALYFDFKGVKMPGTGIEMYIKSCEAFNHAGSMGHDDLSYKGKGVFIPCGQALNAKTNEMQPYLQIRYAEPKGAAHTIQGDIQVWEDGANAKTGPTSGVMERNVHMISYKALQAFQMKKFFVVDPA